MTDQILTEQDWAIRAFIYEFFVANACPPTSETVAQKFGMSKDDAIATYHRLNADHQIFLELGTDNVRMANPLSAVVTDYRVRVNDIWLYANCAWDTLGIAAMCQADALIEATPPVSQESITYHVKNGTLQADERLVVHFALPVRRWYDDLVHT